MYFREATQADIPAMGAVQRECGETDAISRYFIKDTDKYPTSARRGAIRFIRKQAIIPGSITFVVETEKSDYAVTQRYKAPEIAGFALYIREGTSEAGKEYKLRHTDLLSKLNRALYWVEERYVKVFTNVNPCYRASLFNKIMPLMGTPFDKEVFAEAWELDLLFVSPDWQRKGVGKRLLQWGFDRATEERVPLILKSSPKGGPVYRAVGFQSLGEVGLRALFDTTEFGGEEPQMWVWEPEACRGMWYERGKAAFEKLRKEGDGSAVAAVVQSESLTT